jgi:opacity protein-like surface antigen
LILKSKILLSIAATAAALMPLVAAAQVAPEKRPTVEKSGPSYKYEAYAGFAYTSLNQVNQSRYGLAGGDLALTRDFTKHFGITANGAYFRLATGSGNPGNPSVWSLAAGPEVRATLYGNMDCFLHALVGVEHTGGENMTPDISASGGFGGGLLYNMSQRWGIRASGDRMYDSFSLANNSPALAYSPHTHYNARATVGVVYRF